MWSFTINDSKRCAVDRSTLSGVEVKNYVDVPLLPPYGVQLTAIHYLVLILRMCGAVPLLLHKVCS